MDQCYQQEDRLSVCITEYPYRGMQCSFELRLCVLIAGFAATPAVQTTSQAGPEWVVAIATSSARFLMESL